MLREPFVHLVALGALVFLLYAAFGAERQDGAAQVVVDPATIASIRARFQVQSKRQPTDAELLDAVKAHVRQEILYREGLAMGFDKDDVIVQRRVVQKMQFLAADVAEARPLEEAQLRSHYQAHPERYRVGARVSLRQLYFSADAHQGQEAELAAGLLGELRAGALDFEAAQGRADRSMRPTKLEAADRQQLTRVFGKDFAGSVLQATAPGLLAPVGSGFGVHLVEVTRVWPEAPVPFEMAKKDIASELEQARRLDTEARLYKGLRKKYRVQISGVELAGLRAEAL